MAQDLAYWTWTIVVQNHYEYAIIFVVRVLFGVT